MKFFSDQFYVKSADEMYELWSDLPEACENTVKIADRIDITLPERTFNIPEYPVPQAEAAAPALFGQTAKTPEAYLRSSSRRG